MNMDKIIKKNFFDIEEEIFTLLTSDNKWNIHKRKLQISKSLEKEDIKKKFESVDIHFQLSLLDILFYLKRRSDNYYWENLRNKLRKKYKRYKKDFLSLRSNTEKEEFLEKQILYIYDRLHTEIRKKTLRLCGTFLSKKDRKKCLKKRTKSEYDAINKKVRKINDEYDKEIEKAKKILRDNGKEWKKDMSIDYVYLIVDGKKECYYMIYSPNLKTIFKKRLSGKEIKRPMYFEDY